MSNARPPLPPFTKAAAIQKVRIGEDGDPAFPKSSDWVYFAR
jgi:nuclear transport factor 2 (NTF2) superfamily protein